MVCVNTLATLQSTIYLGLINLYINYTFSTFHWVELMAMALLSSRFTDLTYSLPTILSASPDTARSGLATSLDSSCTCHVGNIQAYFHLLLKRSYSNILLFHYSTIQLFHIHS